MSKRYIHIYVVKTNKHGLCGQNVKDDNIQVAPSKSRSKEKNLQLSTVYTAWDQLINKGKSKRAEAMKTATKPLCKVGSISHTLRTDGAMNRVWWTKHSVLWSSDGWKRFAFNNSLQLGQRYYFELLKHKKHAMYVRVIHLLLCCAFMLGKRQH
jgi:hypothetical protein